MLESGLLTKYCRWQPFNYHDLQMCSKIRCYWACGAFHKILDYGLNYGFFFPSVYCFRLHLKCKNIILSYNLTNVIEANLKESSDSWTSYTIVRKFRKWSVLEISLGNWKLIEDRLDQPTELMMIQQRDLFKNLVFLGPNGTKALSVKQALWVWFIKKHYNLFTFMTCICRPGIDC